MRNYEVTFIVDPVQDGKDIKAVAQKYVDMLQKAGAKIVHVNELGLRELAYAINKRTSGVYYCVEFEAENGNLIAPMELAMRRDETIMRFLTVSLDKYGVKYNQDKRDGKIGVAKKPVKKVKPVREKGGRNDRRNNRNRDDRNKQQAKPAPKKAAPAAPIAKDEEE
jgi:small subunit ribosomal protein S6